MNKSLSASRVFFNASVIIAGLKSPSGGSAKLLQQVGKNQIKGIISEIVLDEVVRHADKIGKSQEATENTIVSAGFMITSAPPKAHVHEWSGKVIDPGDAHVLASAIQSKCTYLVTLDKKHILILKRNIKDLKIITPGEFIQLKP